MESIASTSAVAEAYAAACKRWPEFAVELPQFSDELARRLGGKLEATQLASLCTDDLYLAIACLNGDRVAIDHLERDYLSPVDHAGRKLDATDDQVAEVRDHLRRILFSAEPGRAGALAEFTGRGDLRGYLEVIVQRELARAINRGRGEQPIEPLLEQLDLSRVPDLRDLHAQYGAKITAAVRAALERLDKRDRALLGYSLVGSWSIAQIGELYGVDRSTTVRWLTTARNTLADQIRKEVSARVQIPLEELYAVVREVRTRINISFLRVL
jgi:RNA polymerase sigma-70 factor, ECF subfamily